MDMLKFHKFTIGHAWYVVYVVITDISRFLSTKEPYIFVNMC